MSSDYDFQMNRGLLILFDLFDASPDEAIEPFQYCTGDEKLQEIRERYSVDRMAGEGNELSKTLNLLHWISTSTIHRGDISEAIPMNTLALMDYSYQKGKDGGINCRMKATILTEMLLSIGIPSRILSLHPLNPHDQDNHVVSQVWLSEMGKWIIVDPTTNSYFLDKNGGIINAIELREMIISGEAVTCGPKTIFGDDTGDPEAYLAYMAKNLFYMHSPVINGFGSEDRDDQKWITLCPKGFDGRKRDEIKLKQIEAFLRSSNSWDETMERRLDVMKQKMNNHDFMYTHSASSFMAPAHQVHERLRA